MSSTASVRDSQLCVVNQQVVQLNKPMCYLRYLYSTLLEKYWHKTKYRCLYYLKKKKKKSLTITGGITHRRAKHRLSISLSPPLRHRRDVILAQLLRLDVHLLPSLHVLHPHHPLLPFLIPQQHHPPSAASLRVLERPLGLLVVLDHLKVRRRQALGGTTNVNTTNAETSKPYTATNKEA